MPFAPNDEIRLFFL